MGWYFKEDEDRTPSEIRMILDRELTGDTSRVLKSAICKSDVAERSHVYYAAYQYGDAVVAIVHPLVIEPDAWGYKDEDEFLGPLHHNCPLEILDMLTPTDHAFALEWRTACRKHHQLRLARAI